MFFIWFCKLLRISKSRPYKWRLRYNTCRRLKVIAYALKKKIMAHDNSAPRSNLKIRFFSLSFYILVGRYNSHCSKVACFPGGVAFTVQVADIQWAAFFIRWSVGKLKRDVEPINIGNLKNILICIIVMTGVA